MGVGEGGQSGDKWGQRDLVLGGGYTVQCADDVLLRSTPEICMVL